MEVRPIDAVQVLHNINLHHRPTPVSEFEFGFNDGLNQAMWEITHVPTLTQPNEPLTLEELREMDGHPVWCEWILDADRETGHGAWFIVVVGKYGLELKKPLDFGCHVCKNENYGTGWLAYRRPPEGEEK